MSILTKDIGNNCYPDWDWYTEELAFYVEDAKTRGIEIGEERSSRQPTNGMYVRYEPAISFSGFYSQGDGLAFDADINWPVFFEANPSFRVEAPEWFLLLVSNPSYVIGGVTRSGRNSTGMSIAIDTDYNDVVECGYFAGVRVEAEEGGLPELYLEPLEEAVLSICRDEATKMYHGLEEVYESECEYMREQQVETIKEEYEELIKAVLLLLPEGLFTRADVADAIDENYEYEIDFEDLDNLGLIEHVSHGNYKLKEKQS